MPGAAGAGSNSSSAFWGRPVKEKSSTLNARSFMRSLIGAWASELVTTANTGPAGVVSNSGVMGFMSALPSAVTGGGAIGSFESAAGTLRVFTSGVRPRATESVFPSKVVSLNVLMNFEAASAAASLGSVVSENVSAVRVETVEDALSADPLRPSGVASAVLGASFFARERTTVLPPSKGISTFAISSGLAGTSWAIAHPFESVSSQAWRLEKKALGSFPKRRKRPLPDSGVLPSVTLQISLPSWSRILTAESLYSRRVIVSGLAVTNRSTFASFRSWTKRAILSKLAGRS